MPSKLKILIFLLTLNALSVPFALAQTSNTTSGANNEQQLNAIPKLRGNGGLRFDSQGAGTPNTLSGYFFLPILASERGDIFFAESYINWSIASDGIDSSIGSSTRLGYRWLTENKSWIYGVNAGIDNRPFQAQNFLQAGVGLEALSPNLELRVNGYIPFSQTSNLYSTAYNGAYGLVNDQLQLNRSRWFGVALGGIDAEVGTPVARWQGGDLRLYAGYYYLDGDYVSGSSGVRARAELRLGDKLSVGGTVSYDDIFQTQATGYVRLGFSPQQKPVGKTINDAEDLFLAQRGLPVDRQRVIQVANQQVRDQEAARDPFTGKQWVVRCVGLNASAYSVRCGYGDLSAAVNAIGAPADVLLLANGTNNNLNGSTLRLPASTNLSNGANAPVLATQGGFIPLAAVYGPGNGAAPQVNNGILSIGSNTSIAGLAFNNTSITNYSTENVLIANNNFVGSYTDNPGGYSSNALPTINLSGVQDVTISNNTFSNPQVASYVSATGLTRDKSRPGSYDSICSPGQSQQANPSKTYLCLNGNAIRITNGSNIAILNNSISGALDEAIRMDNPNGTLTIANNTITGMRNGPDTNIQAAIFTRLSSGNLNYTASNNFVSDNAPGILVPDGWETGSSNPSKGSLKQLVTSLLPQDLPPKFKPNRNNVDPFEIGLCRGDASFPDAADKYGDGILGNCNSPTSMNLMVINNNFNVTNAGSASDDNSDGIDFNTGQNAIFSFQATGNSVTSRSGNPLTADFRANTIISSGLISENNLISIEGDDAPIDIEFSSRNGATNNGYGQLSIIQAANTLQRLDAAGSQILKEGQQIKITAGTDVQPPSTSTYGNYNLTITPPYALQYPGTSNLGWQFNTTNYDFPNSILYPAIKINNKPQSCNGNKSCP